MKTKIKLSLITCLLSLTTAQHLYAQVASLDSLLAKIERSNPSLASYEAHISALDNYATGARSWEAPRIGAGIWNTPYRHFGDDNYRNNGQIMFTAEQWIPNPEKLRTKQAYLSSMSAVEKENKNFWKNQLFAAAKSAYYDWVILEKKQTVLTETETLYRYIISAGELNYTFGKEKLDNIYKAKAGLYELQNVQVALQSDIQQKNIELNTLLNQDKAIVFDVDTAVVLKNYDQLVLDSTTVQTSRSDIRALNRSIELNVFNQKMEWSQRLPDFGIRAEHMSAFGNQANFFSLMGMISIPIAPWSAKGYKAKLNGLRDEHSALKSQKQAIINETSGRLRSLAVQIGNYKKRLHGYTENILPVLRSNYKTTLLAYEQNTGNLFIVLDAIRALNDAQLQYFEKLQETLQLQVSYEKEIEQY